MSTQGGIPGREGGSEGGPATFVLMAPFPLEHIPLARHPTGEIDALRTGVMSLSTAVAGVTNGETELRAKPLLGCRGMVLRWSLPLQSLQPFASQEAFYFFISKGPVLKPRAFQK